MLCASQGEMTLSLLPVQRVSSQFRKFSIALLACSLGLYGNLFLLSMLALYTRLSPVRPFSQPSSINTQALNIHLYAESVFCFACGYRFYEFSSLSTIKQLL